MTTMTTMTTNNFYFSAHTMYLLELTGDSYSVMAEWNAGLQWGGEEDEVEMADFNAACDRHYADERAYEASRLQDEILFAMAEGRSPYDPNFCDTCGYANPCPDHCPEGCESWDDIPF